MYWSSYMVDYEALTGLSLLRVSQQSVWLGASCALTMPLIPHQWLCLGPFAGVRHREGLRGVCTVTTLGPTA
jgi:hypothetical protein